MTILFVINNLYTWKDSHIMAGLILGLRSANERRRCNVTASLIGWAQT